MSNIGRAADIAISTCLRGVNLNKSMMGCEVSDVAERNREIGKEQRFGKV